MDVNAELSPEDIEKLDLILSGNNTNVKFLQDTA